MRKSRFVWSKSKLIVNCLEYIHCKWCCWKWEYFAYKRVSVIAIFLVYTVKMLAVSLIYESIYDIVEYCWILHAVVNHTVDFTHTLRTGLVNSILTWSVAYNIIALHLAEWILSRVSLFKPNKHCLLVIWLAAFFSKTSKSWLGKRLSNRLKGTLYKHQWVHKKTRRCNNLLQVLEITYSLNLAVSWLQWLHHETIIELHSVVSVNNIDWIVLHNLLVH